MTLFKTPSRTPAPPPSAKARLLPQKVRVDRHTARRNRIVLIAGTVFILVLAGLYIAEVNRLNNVRAQVAEAQARVTQVQAEVASLERFAVLAQNLTTRNEQLATAMRDQLAWSTVFTNLVNAFPQDSSLIDLSAAYAREGGSVGTLEFSGFTNTGFVPGIENVLLRLEEVEEFDAAFVTESGLAPDIEAELLGPDQRPGDAAAAGGAANFTAPNLVVRGRPATAVGRLETTSDFDGVRWRITVTGPAGALQGRDASEVFRLNRYENRFTDDSDEQAYVAGFNESVTLRSQTNDIQGYVGPEEGFPLNEGVQPNYRFRFAFPESAPVGYYAVTFELVDSTEPEEQVVAIDTVRFLVGEPTDEVIKIDAVTAFIGSVNLTPEAFSDRYLQGLPADYVGVEEDAAETSEPTTEPTEVPTAAPTAAPTDSTASTDTVCSVDQVNLNTARAADLRRVVHLDSPEAVRDLVDHRPYDTLDDLPPEHFGPQQVSDMRQQGIACVG